MLDLSMIFTLLMVEVSAEGVLPKGRGFLYGALFEGGYAFLCGVVLIARRGILYVFAQICVYGFFWEGGGFKKRKGA